jgi:hypothetical protein
MESELDSPPFTPWELKAKRLARQLALLRAVAEAADEACRSCHAEDGLTLPPARASMEKLERAIYDARKGGAM